MGDWVVVSVNSLRPEDRNGVHNRWPLIRAVRSEPTYLSVKRVKPTRVYRLTSCLSSQYVLEKELKVYILNSVGSSDGLLFRGFLTPKPKPMDVMGDLRFCPSVRFYIYLQCEVPTPYHYQYTAHQQPTSKSNQILIANQTFLQHLSLILVDCGPMNGSYGVLPSDKSIDSPLGCSIG